jgi:hypothetical protein
MRNTLLSAPSVMLSAKGQSSNAVQEQTNRNRASIALVPLHFMTDQDFSTGNFSRHFLLYAIPAGGFFHVCQDLNQKKADPVLSRIDLVPERPQPVIIL